MLSTVARAVCVALVLLCVATFGAPARAQTAPAEPPPPPAPTSVAVPLLAAPPSMGGVLDASWQPAARVTLGTDFTYRRPVDEATEVAIAQDGTSLDVAFVVTQREPRTEAQQTNGSGVQSDDYVGVYLFPRGSQGFQYGFFANPRGTRYQFSSENSAYSPQWTATGHPTSSGYVVTMRIPLDVIRSGGSTTWRAQFVRATVATGGLAVWSYAPRATNATDPTFAGTLTGVGAKMGPVRPKARAQVYGLGELTTPANGGNTSRAGLDFAVPVTPTASFLGTVHPDYSNVEIDQQTIAPSAFPYQYAEVRPFFTQAGQPFNPLFGCSNCPTLLYTPAIPTFREGYAVEGTQGPITFGAFDAIGYGRADQGQVVNWTVSTPQTVEQVATQRIAVDTASGVHDEVDSVTSGIMSQKTHFLVYGNAAFERGSQVATPGQGDYLEYGVGYASATTTVLLSAQRIGAQFAPVDGYVAQNDLTGYEFVAKKTLTFSPASFVHDVQLSEFISRFHDSHGAVNQTTAAETVGVDLKNLLTFRVSPAAQGVRLADGEFLPFGGNTLYLGYRVATTTPTYVRYTEGPYYHGKLDAYTYLSTIPLRNRLRLTLEADQNSYRTAWAGETSTTQWLERGSLDWQLSKDASFDVGARRIIGTFVPNAFQLPPFPYVNAGNVSLAFHLLNARNELYVVYGDPNSLATTPALFVKWIRYVGAPKGT